MDYMDYQPGYAQFLFTEGQMYRSRTQLESIFDQYKIDFGSCSALNSTQDELQSLLLYPNPSDGTVTISVPLTSGNSVSVSLTNMLGVILFEKDFQTSSMQFTQQMNWQQFKTGVYVVTILNGKNSYTKKLIIE
jgi:hypothetical protein